MQVISAREFRANQTKILRAARDGQSVLLTSRVGNFRIVPITEDDSIVARELEASIAEAEAHAAGKITLHSAKDLVF